MTEWWDALQQAVFENLILPLMLSVGLDAQLEEGYAAALWLMVGLLQLLVSVSGSFFAPSRP